MGIGGALKRLFGGKEEGHGLWELARRLGTSEDELSAFKPSYREFTVPKRSRGKRVISAPEPETKKLQRRILRRLLAGLKAHPAAMGFERARSIVTNALPHRGKAVLVSMDVQDFFRSTSAKRVRDYFVRIGWGGDAADALVRLVTHKGSLPQGAPTSPRLSNLVNFRLDARLAALAAACGADYTRYADDVTLSFAEDDPRVIAGVIRIVKEALSDCGYKLHMKRKLHIRRRHDCQCVTGLVVNRTPNLPRARRRWLRAVEHHVATGRPSTLSKSQLTGWRAFCQMVERRRDG